MSTAAPRLEELLPIALDITMSLRLEDRFQRLVDAVVRVLPCDAAVLLSVEGDLLRPVACHGVSKDVLGRAFPRREHPRLDILCHAEGPTVIPADSPLADPFDGMVDGAPDLDVHACMGCPLRIDGELVGVLTVDSIQAGVFDGIPISFLEHLAALAAAAMRTGALIDALESTARQRGHVARGLVEDVLHRRGGLLLGASEPMERLRREIELVAASDLPVLVTGETGVGKELVVRTLHAQSRREEHPLVYVNCAALPESVVESELFGHERGAFTGADHARPGKFKVADGASLLLDEIGEMPLSVQPKLLRFLQEGEIQRVGSDGVEHVDVRVLAATNRVLETEVRAGRFRSDLLHRLDVCRIHVPPLRERPEDVPPLAGHFADRARRQLGVGPVRFAEGALAHLAQAPWPGNVRELENVVLRAILRASGREGVQGGDRGVRGDGVVVQATDLEGFDLAGGGAPEPPRVEFEGKPGPVADVPASLRDSVREFQRAHIRGALAESGGNWSAAARALGMHRSNLHHLAARLGLR